MKQDMNRMLIEATIRRVLKNIQESPERAVRNLVDLGLEFSDGRFQKQFLRTTQKMLRNQESAYYSLVRNVIDTVDPDILTTFGVNLGYNGCTKGAKKIREIEAEQGFNIPWSLSLSLNEEKLVADPGFYPDLLRQGVSLGIYTYVLFTLGNPEKVIPLIQGEPDCAFVFFLRGHQITDSFLAKMKGIKNVMFAVYDNEHAPSACQMLRESKQLYSVYLRYTAKDKERILSEEWFESILPMKPAFVILRTDEHDQPELRRSIYQHVIAVRNSQQYPFILMDLKYDVLAIDRIVSDGECVAGFDADGKLRTHEGINGEERFNIFSNSLERVLRAIQVSN
ncbi:hypothetical protein [Yanshouia hominis]|uniref:Uncharacterized protein n=1 Tax=Yanshouia hominis TaxID=2763673 RepID=A0ABR7NFI1_9FIRM|nr:hypothetical protein [Yanshouia hominis]MBC8575168.1 hypothetical protein [Yanshouia hominis]